MAAEGAYDGASIGPVGVRRVDHRAGIKDDAPDFTTVLSTGPAAVSAVFTRSRFAGPSIVLSRDSAAKGSARGIAVISRNANVATGAEGLANAREVRELVAGRAGLDAEEVLIASTGVIGRSNPMDRVRAGLAAQPSPARWRRQTSRPPPPRS